MGISLSGIHIFSSVSPADCPYVFLPFSEGWQTCTEDFSETSPQEMHGIAKRISKSIEAPVLLFGVADSDSVWFSLFLSGKTVARYSDSNPSGKTGIGKIAELLGYPAGNRRLSSILKCADAEKKIALLEEYFGVCLLYAPEFCNEPEILRRSRGDMFWQKYHSAEKSLTGKSAPFRLELVSEQPGKLFLRNLPKGDDPRYFKPFCFLLGYETAAGAAFHPVRFTEGKLVPISTEEFYTDQIPHFRLDPRFNHTLTLDVHTVSFSKHCPPKYHGKKLALPAGFIAKEFLPSGELLLCSKNQICIVDTTLKIAARLPCKGEFAEFADGHVLTVTHGSFYAGKYDPKAKIRIYRLTKK
ncbi:MAG: hypothetical protein E7335_00295 [Clostridiales bacterium]|nr:hypothetical protein [Clostridiales bacterium]